jgi:uncharacterized protein (TIGR03067 family)
MKARLLLIATLGALAAADSPKDDNWAKDLKKLQGDWAALSMVVDGEKIPDDEAQALFRTIKDDQYTVFRFNKAIGKGTFKLDATKKPKTIDVFPANAGPKAKPILGIYELDDKSFKFCYARPGKGRPTDFSAKQGSGHTLTVWEREKK